MKRAARARGSPELARAQAELEIFTAAAGHNMREPARKILGFAGVLGRGRLDPSQRRALARIQEAARRMAALSAGLCRYAGAARGKSFFADADLTRLAREVLKGLGRLPPGVELRLSPLPRARVDAAQIRELLRHLLVNALKFRAAKNAAIEIRGRVLKKGGVALSVKDNGLGFDPAYREKIFEPFQRLNPPDAYPGAGLGLAICRRIAQRHGGSITSRSSPGKGAAFTLRLPPR